MKWTNYFVIIFLVFVGITRSSGQNSPKSNLGCKCYQELEVRKPGTHFYPALEDFVKYDDFTLLTGWKLPNAVNGIKALNVKDFMNQVGSMSIASKFTVVSYNDPIILIAPGNAFSVNLTPCASNISQHEAPLYVTYSHSVRNYVRNFDYKTFDRSAKSYLNVLLQVLSIGNRQLIENILDDYEDSEHDLKKLISTLNSKYQVNIQYDAANNLSTANSILDNLKLKKINIQDFIVTEFIQTDKTIHVINEVEKRRLEDMFNNNNQMINIDDLDRDFIKPSVQVGIDVKKVGFTIDSKILRPWDGSINKVTGKKISIPKSTTVLADVTDLDFSTRDGLVAKITGVCMPKAEISGTKIFLFFNNVKLLSSTQQDPYFELDNYPLFRIKPSTKKQIADDNFLGYTSDLTDFKGLLVDESDVEMIYKGQQVNFKGKNLIINNSLIAGRLDLVIKGDQSKPTFVITTESKEISTNVEEFRKTLTQLGFEVQIIKHSTMLVVFFKKLANK